ncbi:hypothetical protein Tco_0420480 [Tanacetum coccineum]
MLKAVMGNKSVDMSGKYGTSNAGAESVGVSDCNKVYKEAGNEAVMSISVDVFVLIWRYVGGRWVWLEFDSMDQVESVKTSKALKEIFLEFKDVSHDFIPDERCVWIDLVGLPFGLHGPPKVYQEVGWSKSLSVSYVIGFYRIFANEFGIFGAPIIESMEVKFEVYSSGKEGCKGPSWMKVRKMRSILDVDSCDSDSPKNVNNDSVSPSSRVLREEDVRGVESDLVDSFEEGEIRDDSVLYNDGCIKDCMKKNLEDDAVIAPEKDSIIAPPSTPPGNDLNIAVESGSSWIDYIGPLTSDEIDSVIKRDY